MTSGVLLPVCGFWPPDGFLGSISIQHKGQLDEGHVRAVVTAGIKASEVALLLTLELAGMFSNRAPLQTRAFDSLFSV